VILLIWLARSRNTLRWLWLACYAHITPLYFEHKILKLNDIFKLETNKFVHKLINKKLPGYFQNYLQNATKIHCYSTTFATKSNIVLFRFITNRTQNSLKFQGAKIWNSISPKIRNLPLHNFGAFATHLYNLILNKIAQLYETFWIRNISIWIRLKMVID